MKLDPLLHSTRISMKGEGWAPASFADFLAEVDHVRSHCASLDHYVLYHGHASTAWRLDSTFARFVKGHILGIDITELIREDYRHSLEFYRLLSSLFLCKFRTLMGPSKELIRVSDKNKGLDPWFELMKRIQQYRKEDLTNLHGTFLIDWTQDWRIALYFANHERNIQDEGAIYLADMTQAGSILHRDLMVGEIIARLHKAFLEDQPSGCPLIFCPRQQIACQRARNQDAIYVAQMDLRLDLAEYWNIVDQERADGNRILLRIYLPKDTKQEAEIWLAEEGIIEDFVYPDKKEAPTNRLHSDRLNHAALSKYSANCKFSTFR